MCVLRVPEGVLLGLHKRVRHSHWRSWEEAVGRCQHVHWLLNGSMLADLAHIRGVVAHYLDVLNATVMVDLVRIHHLLPILVIVGSYWLLHFEHFRLLLNVYEYFLTLFIKSL